jgi:hypothetical protein
MRVIILVNVDMRCCQQNWKQAQEFPPPRSIPESVAVVSTICRYDGSNDDYGAWIEIGRDERIALRATCNATEAPHKLAFGSAAEGMAQKATFWLTYLPEHRSHSAENRRAELVTQVALVGRQ